MNRKGLIIAAASGLGLAGLLIWRRNDVYLALDAAKKEAFKLALPSTARQYADDIWTVSNETGISPLVIYGVGDRESNWGAALRPPGPGGTGDFTPRDPATWGSALPPDGKGWGRGLMQLDYYHYKSWLDSNPWWVPIVMIRKATQELKKHFDFFASKKPLIGSPTVFTDGKRVNFVASSAKSRWGVSGDYLPDPRPLSGNLLVRAALASYNGGDAYVLRSVAAGKDPDFTTTGGNYSQHILTRIVPLYDKIAG